MTKKWVVGLCGVVALIAVAGTGFAAFTASATVNGGASAATLGLEIVSNETTGCPEPLNCGCYDYYNAPGAPGEIQFTGLSPSKTTVSLQATNLVPDTYCAAQLTLQNTGSIPENISVALVTAGSNGICTGGEINCYGVFTISGIASDGTIYWYGSPHYGVVEYSSVGFVTLAPGGTFLETIGVDIPPTSTDATPASATFSLVYSTSAGI